jgi:hypothetical protein
VFEYVDSYVHDTEGKYNISFQLLLNNTASFNTSVIDQVSDLYNPSVIINFTLNNGFNEPATNITLTCHDTVYDNLSYNLTFNNVTYFVGNHTNNTEQLNESTLRDGVGVLIGECGDLFGSTKDNITRTIYYKQVILINEINNSEFDVSNISGAIVYFDDNSSFFDFQAEGNVSVVNFTTFNNDKLRVELLYDDTTYITRYVDVSVDDDNEIRVCANEDGTTHYEQLIIASSKRRVIVKSVYANCVVAADYTRFGYEDAYLLKAFSIDRMYYVYAWDDNDDQVLLTSIDGSVQAYINIDTLEFKQNTYDIEILSDTIVTKKTSNNTIQIYYYNIKDNNDDINVTITNLDTGSVVFTSDDFADPNEVTMYFDYTTLGVTNYTLFQIDVTRIIDGEESVVTRYFDTKATTAILKSEFAAMLSFFLVVFGLSFAISRITFSWFGIIIILCAIGLLSFAIVTWYITLLFAVYAILLVYVVLNMTIQNYTSIS